MSRLGKPARSSSSMHGAWRSFTVMRSAAGRSASLSRPTACASTAATSTVGSTWCICPPGELCDGLSRPRWTKWRSRPTRRWCTPACERPGGSRWSTRIPWRASGRSRPGVCHAISPSIDLGAVAARHAIQRSGVPAGDFGHTVFGNALQTSADAIYMARHVGLKAGLPIETPAVTVNRLCGSGFEAITQGAQLILLGEAEAVLAGGAESMSQAPHVVRGARWGLRLGPAPLEDLLWEALKDP